MKKTYRTVARMKPKPYTRPLSAALALLIMISLVPFSSCGSGTSQQPQSAEQASQAPTTPEDIQAQMAQEQQTAPPSAQEEAISGLTTSSAIAAELAADPARAATDTEALKASVADSTAKLSGTVTQAGDKLSELGLDSKRERYGTESAKVLAALDAVKNAADSASPDNPASYGLLSQTIDEAFASPEPAILSSDLSHLAEDDTPIPPVYGASIAPAYLAGAPGLTPSTLPAEPGDGDLAETIDAPQTEEITTLASQLGNDPVAIYEWVHNNIDFECYFGSRKGAAGTLAELAGNSTDTASLLISLLRASGVPARYVTGVIQLTAAQACSWLATDNISDAQSLLASAGIPTTGIIEGGALSKLELTQTWTEAYVNYDNYRGHDVGGGPRDWIPLDASYKTYEVVQPQVDILSAMGASYDTLSTEYLSSVKEESFLSFIETKIKTWLLANMPSLTLADVMRTKSIKQENLGVLPSVLPYSLVSAESEERELAASSRWKATITVAGTSLTSDLVSLSSGALEVSFSAATDEDQALLSAYENISDIPAYLLDMVAEITAGDQTVQTSTASLGSSSSWSLAITSPTRSYNISNTLTWGAPFSVSLAPAPGPVNGEIKMDMGPNFPMCLFTQASQSYVSSITGDDDELASIYALNLTKGAQEASVGMSLTPQLATGVAISATPDGIYIDADLSTATPTGFTKAGRKDFTLTSGLSSSAHEHLCLQDSFSAEAVSTAKFLALANQDNIPIVAVSSSNASLLETLTLPAYVKAQMKDQISSGYVITTPAQTINCMDFTGEGWMVTDPATGEGAYLISGGLSGGEIVEKSLDLELFCFLFFAHDIENVLVKNITATSEEFPDPSLLPGGEILANAEYNGGIAMNTAQSISAEEPSFAALGIGTFGGGSTRPAFYTVNPQNPVQGHYLMGSRIKVESTYLIVQAGEERTLHSRFTIDTSRACYEVAGWYQFFVDLSKLDLAVNPYRDNTDLNPILEFEILPVIWKVKPEELKDNSLMMVAAIGDYKMIRNCSKYNVYGGGEVELTPEFLIEVQGNPEGELAGQNSETIPFVDFIFYENKLLIPENARGRYIVSFYEQHSFSLQYFDHIDWDPFYETLDPAGDSYIRKLFFDLDITEGLFFVSQGTDHYLDWNTEFCGPSSPTDLLLRKAIADGTEPPDEEQVFIRLTSSTGVDDNDASIPDWTPIQLKRAERVGGIQCYRLLIDPSNHDLQEMAVDVPEYRESDESPDVPEVAAADFTGTADSNTFLNRARNIPEDFHYRGLAKNIGKPCEPYRDPEPGNPLPGKPEEGYPVPGSNDFKQEFNTSAFFKAGGGVEVLEASLDASSNIVSDRILYANQPDWLYIAGHHRCTWKSDPISPGITEYISDDYIDGWGLVDESHEQDGLTNESPYYGLVKLRELQGRFNNLDLLVVAACNLLWTSDICFNDDVLQGSISQSGGAGMMIDSGAGLILGYRDKSPDNTTASIYNSRFYEFYNLYKDQEELETGDPLIQAWLDTHRFRNIEYEPNTDSFRWHSIALRITGEGQGIMYYLEDVGPKIIIKSKTFSVRGQ